VSAVEAPGNLAPEEFWEDEYYRGLELPVRPDPDYPYERCLMRALEQMAPATRGASVLELGCAPARWLVWYAERFGAHVTGLESSPKGVVLSRENLAAAAVSGEIREGDFFTAELGEFDLVLSLGFIEHFDDLSAAFARHVAFLKPGGKLVVGVPNFRGLIGSLQRWSNRDFLALHNQQAMEPRRYEQLASEHGLASDATRYVDGIDPDLVKVSRLSVRLALMPLRVWRMFGLSERINGPLISSYLVMTFVRQFPDAGDASSIVT
jgi:SAM-dependent methyltransferase